jgi:ring-1,2-phenylacetyl-CoA epoxidase subunit PaaD
MKEVKEHIDLKQEVEQIWHILEAVPDPEIPVLSIADLGIIRNVEVNISDDGKIEGAVTITPTYSGCPAMDVIAMQVKIALLEHGYTKIQVKQQLSPAWTTDWMTEKGKDKLKAYGIAPPSGKLNDTEEAKVQCPHCNSYNTGLLSQFGSTPCKALYKCNDCQEPFDYFKCH